MTSAHNHTHDKPVYKGWTGSGAVDLAKDQLVEKEFEVKPWDEDDVEVKVLYCGVCGTDIMALEGLEGPAPPNSICGHEIIGQVVKVGSKVENNLKVGQHVGIGYESDSCRECDACLRGQEQACANMTRTFFSKFRRGNGTGAPSQGGFAKYWRGPSKFAIPIPDGVDLSVAGPLMCGGVTMYSPLKRWNVGPGKRVGIIGVGGLGHMGVLFAKAMGAEVTAISRSGSKKEDAEKLGADRYIATGDDIGKAFKEYGRYFDMVICTSNPKSFPIQDYLPILNVEGVFCFIGLIVNPITTSIFPLIERNLIITASAVGSPSVIAEMFNFVKEKQIKPWVQKFDMDDINRALTSFKKGDPRYRYVLVNTDNGGEL
ncbi:hypothetical protein I302_102979 [Kwoniella bestiolae CBS 10118]|uniref:Enoyl reductase (ER) domain-containing protein n=1 Tax=Kwoniella bestiolae CBS 10118 TaxID=1296100 RepID=A0A1B9GGL3_9TREE|nr:hypothetical protein I302_01675 [Kwoniella bestiolae CBS 10118]OCF30156.1 hypothetical protein I302_01675 [Kwoniella bestiolae CBS 10118]